MNAPEQLLEIQDLSDGHRVRLRLRGELDLSTTGDLQRVLDGACGCEEILLDLSDLSFIDSSGISLFLTAHKRATADGQKFVLRFPAPSVLKAFEVGGVADVLVIES